MRNYGIDCLRLICLFLVIVIHASFGDEQGRDSILRGMPYANGVFAFLAGWYMKVSQDGWLAKRIRRLFIPYVIWTSLFMLLHVLEAVRTGSVLLPPTRQIIRDVFFGTSSVQLWFIISLFYIQLLMCMGVKLLGRRLFLPFMIVLCIASYVTYPISHGVVRCLLFICMYSSLGWLFRRLSDKFSVINDLRSNKIVVCCGIALVYICYRISIPSVLEVLIWCAAFSALDELIFTAVKTCKVDALFEKVVSTVMGVYLVHWLVLRGIFKPILPYTAKIFGYGSILIIVNSTLALAISIIVVYSTRKWKWIWG